MASVKSEQAVNLYLDVEKKTEFITNFIKIILGLNTLDVKMPHCVGSVSYTHLDVYKRQAVYSV